MSRSIAALPLLVGGAAGAARAETEERIPEPRLSPTARRWGLVWHCWLAGTAASFAALEARALASGGEAATLSAHLRRTLGMSPRRNTCVAGQLAIGAAFGWCAGHLAFGIWPAEGWLDRD